VDSGEPTLPMIDECETPTEYFTGIGLNKICNEMGMQQFRTWLNQKTGGNAARTMKRYHRFFSNEGGLFLTQDQLYESYRESVVRQLAA
jgi:hypothetical protein